MLVKGATDVLQHDDVRLWQLQHSCIDQMVQAYVTPNIGYI